jgi:hypothetical protein
VARKKVSSLARLAVRTLMSSNLAPGDVVKVLRPPELSYLCEICDELRVLRICDDVFFDDEEEEEDAEESD